MAEIGKNSLSDEYVLAKMRFIEEVLDYVELKWEGSPYWGGVEICLISVTWYPRWFCSRRHGSSIYGRCTNVWRYFVIGTGMFVTAIGLSFCSNGLTPQFMKFSKAWIIYIWLLYGGYDYTLLLGAGMAVIIL